MLNDSNIVFRQNIPIFHMPVQLLCISEFLLTACFSYVKWKDVWSEYFCVKLGEKQAFVLSPILFAIYMNDLAKSSLLMFNSYIVVMVMIFFC